MWRKPYSFMFLVCLLIAHTAEAQNIAQPVYSYRSANGYIPSFGPPQSGIPILQQSNLQDNGTQLLYKGTPIGSGNGTVSTGTSNYFTWYAANGTTVTNNLRFSESSGTTIIYSGTGGIQASSFSTNGTQNGFINFTTQGVTATPPVTGQVQFTVGTVTTPYSYVVPPAAPTTRGVMSGTNSSNVVTGSFLSLTGNGTSVPSAGTLSTTAGDPVCVDGNSTMHTGSCNVVATTSSNTFTNTNLFTGIGGSNVMTILNNVISPLSFVTTGSYTYHHSSLSSTDTFTCSTQLECAILFAASQADSSTNNQVIVIPPHYTGTLDASCIPAPANGSITIMGHGKNLSQSSRIQSSSCVGYMYQDSPVSSPGGGTNRINNVTFDMNGVAAGAFDFEGGYARELEHVVVENGKNAVTSGNPQIKFGTLNGNFYKGYIYDVQVTGIMNGMTATQATVAADGSGNIANGATITTTVAGSGYLDTANTYTLVEGAPSATTDTPCSTMGVVTATITSGVPSLAVTSPFSGCNASATLYLTPLKIAPSSSGVDFGGATDMSITDLTIEGVGTSTCLNVGSSAGALSFIHYHPTYCIDNIHMAKNVQMTNTENDSTLRYATYDTATQPITVQGSEFVFASSLGFTYPYFAKHVFAANVAASYIGGEYCNGNMPGTNALYYETLLTNGTTNTNATNGALQPSNLTYIGNGSCSASWKAIDALPNGIGEQLFLVPTTQVSSTNTAANSNRLTFRSENYSGGILNTDWQVSLTSGNNLSFTNPARTTVNPGPGQVTFVDSTLATASTNQNSPTVRLGGTDYTGSASQGAYLTLQNVTPALSSGFITATWGQTGAIGLNMSIPGNDGTTGGVVTAGAFITSTKCSSSASPAVCSSYHQGFGSVVAGTNPTLVVNTTSVTATSAISAVVDQTLGTALGVTCNTTLPTGSVTISSRTAGTSFTVEVPGTFTTNPVCISWVIN